MTPFRFHSIYRPRIWGGEKMSTLPGRDLPDVDVAYGEAWEVSDRPEAMSVVREGDWQGHTLHELWENHRAEIFGAGYEHHPRFPLLCKILGVREKLSIQIHPPAQTAKKWGGEEKHETWYVLHAEPDAIIYGGVKDGVDVEALRHEMEEHGHPEKLLKTMHLTAGQHLYIPAGLIHCIGGGHLIAEVQQNSDTTYRLYDWDRTDAHGNSRELHREQAIDAFAEFCQLNRDPDYLTNMPYFSTTEQQLDADQEFTQQDSSHFAIFTVLRGSICWNGHCAKTGDFILSPAHATPVKAGENGALLMITTAPPAI